MGETAMSKTRREFIREVTAGAAGLAGIGAFHLKAADLKYAHYVHKIKYGKGKNGPGDADYFVRMNGKDLNDRDTNFSFGYYSKLGAWNSAEPAGHAHPFDECLVFAGLEPKDPNYLGAEIEICLGKEYEKHIINVPSIVCIPSNLPHGPIETKKAEKPFAHYSIGLARDYTVAKLPGKAAVAPSRNQYAHLIKKMSATGMANQTKIGSGNADWLSWPKSKDLEGFIVNFTWGFYSGLGSWHNIPGFDPHVHEGDEFLVFVGLNAGNPDYLGAEIEQYLGKEEEMHMVTSPQVFVCPAMFTHAPVVTKKVDKTYGFFLIRRDTGERYSPDKKPAKKAPA
jgi:hypothetical protein